MGGEGGWTGVVEVSLSVFLRRLLVLFFLPFLLIACAQFYVNDIELQQKCLAFLEDGKTDREEIVLRLGRPESQFENGRIWIYGVYEMLLNEEGLLEVCKELYFHGEYNLVLVFDRDVLKRYSLLRIRSY